MELKRPQVKCFWKKKERSESSEKNPYAIKENYHKYNLGTAFVAIFLGTRSRAFTALRRDEPSATRGRFGQR